ncbi:response regulator [Oceanicoccus sagamiensis]|uniref:DNA-binding response regulator n=1 Tax=Oceanicoccus sagamiensis TaxID=716816 RepID=A0A1X9NFK4_9GAMM|nr:response regulator transcription factor [Oceanicoccus sagamiensis]ARN74655.1 hypothetical protein BST96_11285 [Oceanicoccus sagamiensis]
MKLLLVDDHTLFREGLSYLLEKLDPEVLILEADSYNSALEKLSDNKDINLILLDLSLPDKDGFEVLEFCLEQFSAIPVAILSASKSTKDMQQAMDMGAVGFIPKDTSSEIMLSALRTMLVGGYYIPTALTKAPAAMTAKQPGDPFYLTGRQLDVVTLVCDGMTNKEIAKQLDLAEATIKMHMSSIMTSLNVTNRTQVAKVAIERKLLT